jgi:hypothetical protein
LAWNRRVACASKRRRDDLDPQGDAALDHGASQDDNITSAHGLHAARMFITILAIALIWSSVSIVTVAVCTAASRADDALATASRIISRGALTRFSQAVPRPCAVNVSGALTL